MNTVYKHETVLGNNVFIREENGIYCVWENRYDPKTHITQMELDIFAEQPNGTYRRFADSIAERAYTDAEIRTVLRENKLELLDCLAELTLESPKADTERVLYIARKKA